MGDLFVKYGYRSADNGTYYSAFKWVADTFDIEYKETYKVDDAVALLKNNNYVVASVGNGLFTTGGHYIVLVGIDGNTLKIYDPYLYSGKFETSTRRGKVTVSGNTVYCSVSNFKKYANAQKFFAYQNTGSNQTNNTKKVTTSTYTRYIKANGGLNVRNGAGTKYKRIKTLANGTKVTISKTSGNWSYITSPSKGWVCSTYLVTTKTTTKIKNTVGKTKKLKAKTTLYSKSNLSGTKYTYLKNTTLTIKKNVSASVDYVYIPYTKRYAYVKNNVYK